MEVEIWLPPKLHPVFLGEADYRGAYGGRGSAKTRSFAKMSAVRGAMWDAAGMSGLIVCGRQFQNSLEESSFSEVKAAIQEDSWLSSQYDIGEKYIRTRSKRINYDFVGLSRNKNSIKSKSRILLFWGDEAEDFEEDAWEKLIPTVREDGSEIWVTWNPESEYSATHKRFRLDPPENSKIVEMNYRDNPKFPRNLEKKRLEDKRKRPENYEHIWEGKFRTAVGIMFKRAWFKFYDIPPASMNLYISTDYAGGLDPDNPDSDPDETSIGVWGVTRDGDLYLVDHWAGQDDTAEAIGKWLEMVGKYKPLRAFDEKGPILRAIDPFIRRAMRVKQTFVTRESLASAGSKADRALGFAALASAGCVYLPKTPSGQKVLNQLCAFNGQDGRPDDDVDMCSLMARGLDFMASAGHSIEVRKPIDDDYDLNTDESDSWKVA